MSADRFVVLGLAPARAPWFAAVGQWATSGAIAAEFVKCLSVEEVRARLASGRAHSAVLADAGLPGLDRDLVAAARAAGAVVLVVDDGRRHAWAPADLGVAAVLPADLERDQLLDALLAHCRPIPRGDQLPPAMAAEPAPLWRGRLVAVCGPGGTGASTAAIALAQGLASDPRYQHRVVLADLARRAEQAMLHDALEVGPGIQELVEAHRLGRPDPDEVRRATFEVPGRGYRLLLGLRRAESWAVLRPRAVDAAVAGLRRAFQVVVADVTGDVEGEREGGSIDVEERNHPARAAVGEADLTLAVGTVGMKGVHSLAGLLRALLAAGVDPGRLQPVLNRAPRNPRARAEAARALAALAAEAGAAGPALPSPVFVPERNLDDALRDGARLPAAVADPLVGAVDTAFRRHLDAPPARAEPARLTPGTLGRWTDAGR